MLRSHGRGRLTLFSLILWLLALGSLPAMATGTYYVSPNGSDSNTGGINDPFLTITKAQTALRAAGGGTVYLRGGTYTLTSTVVFNEQDSNSTYEAYSGEVPIISGGVVLTNWTLVAGYSDIYQTSVTWNFRGLFNNGVRLNYKNPITYTYPTQFSANVSFTDSAGPTSLVNAGDWALDNVNHIVYYKTGGGAPTGTIVAGSLGQLFYVAGSTETTPVTNLTFDHLYFFYNNWLIPGADDTTYTDSWGGAFSVTAASCGVTGGCVGEIPGAVEVEFANNVTFRSCRVAHNASDGISFGRGVVNSQVVGSEVWDNAGNGIRFGYKGNTGTGGWLQLPGRDPNGQTLTYVWYGDANWAESNDVVTDDYSHDNDVLFPTTANIEVSDLSDAQVSYNRTDNSHYSSIIADELYGTYYKADYNHISNTNTTSALSDGGGIYSLSGQLAPNTGITGEYIGNLVHDTYGLGPLYIDTSNDSFTVNNNVTYNVNNTTNNPLANHQNNATLSGNNTAPTQAQINAAAASTGPRSPYYQDLFGGDTTVTFADRPTADTPLTGAYGGMDWGSQLWYTSAYQGVYYAWMNSSSTSQVTQTFTLPTGKVLKGLSIIGAGTVVVSSSGNTDQTYTAPGTWTAFTTGWTTASAIVTVKVTNPTAAWGTSFTNIIYGTPPPGDTTVTFADRPTADTPLTGAYGGIDWGSQLWYTSAYQGVYYAWVNSSSTSQVTQTFTLPTGKVLKGLSIIGAGTVVVSSSGNTDQTYTASGTWTAFTTGWTTASATVTVKVTNPTAAWGTSFTNIIYGNP